MILFEPRGQRGERLFERCGLEDHQLVCRCRLPPSLRASPTVALATSELRRMDAIARWSSRAWPRSNPTSPPGPRARPRRWSPPPGAEVNFKRPPRALIRSRIPSTPRWPFAAASSSVPRSKPCPSSATDSEMAVADRTMPHSDAPSPRMAKSIGDGLLHHPEAGDLQIGRQAGGRSVSRLVRLQLDGHARDLAPDSPDRREARKPAPPRPAGAGGDRPRSCGPGR